MKRLFALAAALVLVLAAAPQARAQGGGGGPGRGMGMGTMLQGITLTAAQQTKVDSIDASFREMARTQLGGGGGGDGRPDSASMAKRRELMMKRAQAIRTVLDASQQKVFDKNLADMQARRPGP